jgi:hypothetical protein
LRPNPEALAQQLYLVSLALEQSIATETWDEVDALIQSRTQLIDKLSSETLAGRAKEIMLLVSEHEPRLIGAVQNAKRSTANESAAFTLAQKAAQAYLAA